MCYGVSLFEADRVSRPDADYQAVLEGTLGIVESLGGYIYLVLISLPTVIGSLFPGAATAAGAALGQKINAVIAGVVHFVRLALKFADTIHAVKAMWDLIERKMNEAEAFAQALVKAANQDPDKDLKVEPLDVSTVLKELQDNPASEIPLLVFEEDEVENVLTGALTGIVTAGMETGVRLILSLLGTAVCGWTARF